MATLSDKINLRGNIEERESVVLLLTAPGLIIGATTPGESIPIINSFPYALSITSIRADVGAVPTINNLVVDILKNGSTMLDGAGLSIPPNSYFVLGTLLNPPTIAQGDSLSYRIDQPDAGTTSRYLTVTIEGLRI